MKITIRLISLFLMCLLVSGCAGPHEFGPYTGKIIDKETGKPIEGAVVFIQFFTSAPNPGGSTSYFADAVEILTDENGEFEIPEQKLAVYTFLHGWEKHGSVIIFKPGYGAFPRHPGTEPKFMPSYSIPESEYVTIKLPRLKTVEERGRNTGKALSFSRSDVPYEEYKLLFEAVNDELRSIGSEPLPDPRQFEWSK